MGSKFPAFQSTQLDIKTMRTSKIETLNDVADKILAGNGILFAGSGFSRSAKNVQGEPLKTASELADFFYSQCGFHKDDCDGDLQNASDEYLEKFGEAQLVDLIRKEFTVAEITDSHISVVRAPWRRMYTTNYDDLLEMASRKASKLLTGVSSERDITQYKDKRTLCIHLNGFVSTVQPCDLKTSFKLTHTSYQSAVSLDSSAIRMFRLDIANAPIVVFVGFSCNNDLDISRIISQYAERGNVVFIVSSNERKTTIARLQKFGIVFDCGLDAFATKIEERRSIVTKSEEEEFYFSSFDLYPSEYDPTIDIKSSNIIDLIVQGSVHFSMIKSSLLEINKPRYYLRRRDLDKACQRIIDEEVKNIVVHSDLGNGKTMFLAGLSALLQEKGYTVFWFRRRGENICREIEQIIKYPKPVIIVDGYSKYLEKDSGLLALLRLYRADTIVIVAERSTLHDVYFMQLERRIFDQEYQTYDLNSLSDEEIHSLIALADDYGLWGDKSSASHSAKFTEISKKYERSLRLFWLAVLKSPVIGRRLHNLLKQIKEVKECFEATVLILCSNILGFDINLNLLIDLLDSDLFANPAFNKNSRIKEIIDFSSNNIVVRSSVLSEYLIGHSNYKAEVADLLVKVVLRIDQWWDDREGNHIVRSIASYSQLQRLFNIKENSENNKYIHQVFSGIKTTRYASRNYHFWLQYAIAHLADREYDLARRYFDTAYSYAKATNADLYQINNHYARYLLENAINCDDEEACMEAFRQAHEILSNREDPNRNKHYPIRVALLYSPFYRRFYKRIRTEDQVYFKQSCEDLLDRIDWYRGVVGVNPTAWVVERCEKELSSILTEIG